MGTVGHELSRRAMIAGERRVDMLPDALAGPAVETVVDRRRGTVFSRTIAPACPAAKRMYDATEDASVVDRWTSVTRQKRLDLGLLLVVQPKQ
jgi:hypothetical protein